ncbi:MAG: hypothetical protein HOL41_00080 [Rhodospirillaceae bacterium]|jgi:hypothetical protein|nr:hypothetical protein [Rhodospirillaceae bacterium]
MTLGFDMRQPITAAALSLAVLGGCTQVSYVDRGTTKNIDTASAQQEPMTRQVDYHLERAFYETPPDCVMVLPARVPKGTDAGVGRRIDDAVARHLNGYLDKVIDARRLGVQARERVLDPAHPGDRQRLGRALRCDTYMEVETAGVSSSYAVVWTSLSIGVRMTLKRVRDDEVLWRGAHTAERSGGGMPITLLGAGAGMFNAGRLAGDKDAVPSMIDDSLRRTLASLPDMRRK